MEFLDIEHDATLKQIEIDRKDPGNVDIVKFIINNNGPTLQLTFSRVLKIDFQMNMGIDALESILTVDVEDDNDVIKEIRQRRAPSGNPLSDLRCFVIITNSTNSTLRVYARSYEITQVDIE